MIVEGPPDVFDKMRTDAPADGTFSIQQSKSGYLQNEELASGQGIPANSRTAYHIERARSSENLEIVKDYPDPLAYRFSLSKSGTVFKKTMTMRIVRLSVLKLLSQGGGLRTSPRTIISTSSSFQKVETI
jgi:hypothetical protein